MFSPYVEHWCWQTGGTGYGARGSSHLCRQLNHSSSTHAFVKELHILLTLHSAINQHLPLHLDPCGRHLHDIADLAEYLLLVVLMDRELIKWRVHQY